MQKLVITDDEFRTLKDALCDWTLDHHESNPNFYKVMALYEQFVEFEKVDEEEPLGEDD